MASVHDLVARIVVDIQGLASGKIALRQFEEDFKQAFKRTGDVRATAAIEGFITNLSSGNVLGALDSVAARLTGIGLVGAIAFKEVTQLVQSAIKAMMEFSKVTIEVRSHLAVPLAKGMGAEGISSRFLQDIQDIQKVSQSAQGFFAAFNIVGQARALKELLQLHGELGKALDYEGQISSQGVSMAAMEAAHDEKGVALAKAKLELDQATYNIEKTKGQSLEAIKGTSEELTQHNKIIALADQEKRDAEDIYNIKVGALNDEQIKMYTRMGQERELNDIKTAGLTAEQESLAISEKKVQDLVTMARLSEGLSADRQAEARLAAETAAADLISTKQRQITEKLSESTRLSFKELLQVPSARAGGAIRLQHDADEARRAQHELDLAEKARLRGDMQEAAFRRENAERIKSGIGSLSDKEKIPQPAWVTAYERSVMMAMRVPISGKGGMATLADPITGDTLARFATINIDTNVRKIVGFLEKIPSQAFGAAVGGDFRNL